jgi:hypothetical protein
LCLSKISDPYLLQCFAACHRRGRGDATALPATAAVPVAAPPATSTLPAAARNRGAGGGKRQGEEQEAASLAEARSSGERRRGDEKRRRCVAVSFFYAGEGACGCQSRVEGAVNVRSPGWKFDRDKFSTSYFLGAYIYIYTLLTGSQVIRSIV